MGNKTYLLHISKQSIILKLLALVSRKIGIEKADWRADMLGLFAAHPILSVFYSLA